MSATEFDLIIVGAGISGLAAAYFIREARPNTRILILEARDRIGGRIRSEELGKAFIEYGAEWIHGVTSNPLTKFITEHSILNLNENPDVVHEPRSRHLPPGIADNASMMVINTSTGRVVPRELINIWFGHAMAPAPDASKVVESHDVDDVGITVDDQLSADVAIEAHRRQKEGLPDVPLDMTLKHLRKSPKWKAKLEKLAQRFGTDNIEVLWNGSYKIYEGFNNNPVPELSTNWIADAGTEEGGDRIPLNGMRALPEFLAKGFDIRLRHIVTSVTREHHRNKISIDTNQGAFEATQVLISVPLGVLKDEMIKFSPELPPRKQAAIERMGFEAWEKVIMRFSERFWPKNLFWLLCGSKNLDETTWMHSIHKEFQEPILVAFVYPSAVALHRNWTEKQIVEKYLGLLQNVFGPVVHKLFVEAKTTSWARNKFSRGSFSGHRIGSGGPDYDIMSEPLWHGRLGFCGEHTNRVHNGTVDAAFFSGHREASRVLKEFATAKL